MRLVAADDDRFADQATRELSDRITVRAMSPRTQLYVEDQDFRIEWIRHRITDLGRVLTTTFIASPTAGEIGFFRFDISEMDGNDRLAF